MNRWGLAFIAVLVACIPIYLHRSASPALLQDTDTAVLLTKVRQRNAPLSWFAGDWPLENHFYRPVSTLSFEVDNRLSGNDPAGYGLTNALLAIASVLLLFWFLRELTDRPGLSAASAALFACWTAGAFYPEVAEAVWVLGPVCLVAGLVSAVVSTAGGLSGKRFWTGVLGCLVSFYASFEVGGGAASQIGQLSSRMIGWLPGRTASVMASFALLSMAAYCRYERTSAEEIPRDPSPTDPPPTKSSRGKQTGGRNVWLWPLFACVAAALAFGSYEQAVMLPAALLGTAILMRFQGYRVRWGWQIAFWVLLAAYLLLRKAVLPAGISGYQQQQLRYGPAVYRDILGYLLPCAPVGWQFTYGLDMNLAMVFSSSFWTTVQLTLGNVAGVASLRKGWVFGVGGLALSAVTFLPMAWAKPFEHYHFWPMAMRSLFATTMVWTALDLLATAASRPYRQAPPRLDPAPGSLPHP